MSERQTHSVYVGHIRDAVEHAISFVAGMTFEDFSADERTSYARCGRWGSWTKRPSDFRRKFELSTQLFPGAI